MGPLALEERVKGEDAIKGVVVTSKRRNSRKNSASTNPAGRFVDEK